MPDKNANKYILRVIDEVLINWKNETTRKPLLLRGPRQVGKSSSVRNLAHSFDFFIEVDFEAQRNLHALFTSTLNPVVICEQLSLFYEIPIIEGKTLLFFDEIQSCLPAISSMRYFYEKMPNLHLIAAGSLLEFALQELPSFGVGRVRSLFIHPFSFNEFLFACSQPQLVEAIKEASDANPLSELIHKKIIGQYKRFMAIGGMPEVVASYVSTGDMLACMNIIDDLVIPVTHSSSNGIPLGAEVDPKKRKMLIFDTGVFQRMLGLNIGELMISENFEVVNKGALAELSVGLELSKLSACYQRDSLYYWHRESVSGNAEIDYVIQKGEKIIPVEVKSGVSGSMQSLHLFLKEKNRQEGIRLSLENFGKYKNIQIIPLYAVTALSETP